MEWKKNLSDYQAEPPAQAWDHIATQLDQEAPAFIQETLYHLDAAPPASVWAEVSNQLGQTVSPPATVKKLWYRNPWNVAAAAAVAAVIFGITYTKDSSQASSGISTAVVSPMPNAPTHQGAGQENTATSDPDPLGTAMKNKDNNYLYFVSKSGETKRLSYKLQKAEVFST
jgi:hypothetical protein